MSKLPDKILSIKEAAELLKITTKTLRRWEESGKLVPQRTKGGHRRYSLKTIQEFKKINRRVRRTSSLSQLDIEAIKEAVSGIVEQESPKASPSTTITPLLPSTPTHTVLFEPLHGSQKKILKGLGVVLGVAVLALIISHSRLGKAVRLASKGEQLTLSKIYEIYQTNTSKRGTTSKVLQAATGVVTFNVNVPGIFKSTAEFQDVITTTTDINVGGDLNLTGAITSPADLVIAPAGGDVTLNGNLILSDTSTLQIGGLTGIAYNAFANADESPEDASITTDNDLYIGGDLEVDGTIIGTLATNPDADTLDGLDSTAFLRSNATDEFTSGTLKTNTGTTLNIAGTFQIAGTAVTSTAAEINFLDATTVTAGGVLFGDGTKITNDSTNLFYDNANNRLGIGTATPTSTLEVTGTTLLTNNTTSNINIDLTSTGDFTVSDAGTPFVTFNDSGNVVLADNSLLDLSLITHDESAIQGIRLPQADVLTNLASGEGFIAWDTDDDVLQVFDGTSWTSVSSSSLFTDGGTTTYLTAATDDFAIGGTDTTSELFFDTSASTLDLNPFGAAAGNTGEIRFSELVATGTEYTGFKAPDSLVGNVVYTLPSADATTSNQLLSSDAAGVLSWIDVSAGAGTLWTDAGAVTHLTSTSDDLAIGGTDTTSELFFDVSASAIDLNPFGTSAGNTGEIRFSELVATGTEYTGFKAPDSLVGSVIYTLPAADATSANQILSSNSSGTLAWIDVSGGSGGNWTDGGTTVYLTNTTDELVLGGTTPLSSSKFSIDGDADQIQLLLQGNATQTTNIFEIETSATGSLFTVDNSGNLVAAGSLTLTGLIDANGSGTHDIAGTLNLSGNTLTSSSDLLINPSGSTIDIDAGTIDYSTQTVNITLNNAIDALNFDSNTLSIDALNNRVGIRTVAPSKALDVKTSVSDVVAIFEAQAVATNAYSLLDIEQDSGTDTVAAIRTRNDATTWTFGIDGANLDQFAISNSNSGAFTSTKLSILTGGNVGIGDTTPDAKLEVLAASGAQLLLTNTDGIDDASFTVDASGNLTIAPSSSLTNITGDLDVSDQGAFGGTGSITTEQILTLAATFADPVTNPIGISVIPTATLTADNANIVTGISADARISQGAFNATSTLSVRGVGGIGRVTGASGTVTGAVGVLGNASNTGAGTLTNAYSLYAGAAGNTGGGTIGTSYGLLLAAQTNATNNYGIWGENGDWVLDVDGDGALGGTTGGGDLALGESGDLVLYHDGTDSFITNNTGILNIDTPGNLVLNSSAGTIDIGNDAVAQNINIGTGGAARTITVGNATGATALAFNSGTGSQTFTSQVITGTTTTSGFVLDATAITSGTAGYVTSDSITTGKLWDINTAAGNTLTTGSLLNVETTSTGVTGSSTGLLGYFNWNPGSTTTATGDLFRINIGSNGNVDNLFNITDNGSSLFSVSETKITSAVPHEFTAAGDVVIAYDLAFTNQTSSFITTKAPFTLQVGQSFESNNLTLETYNAGDIVLNNVDNGLIAIFEGDTGNVGIGTTTPFTRTGYGNPWLTISSIAPGINLQDSNAANTNRYISNSGGQLEIGLSNDDGTSPQTQLTILSGGNVGIGDISPDAKLEVLATTEQLRLSYADGTDAQFTVDLSGNLTIAPSNSLTNITGDLDVSDQGAFGSAGAITAGQTLRVDNSFTDTSGTVYSGFFLNQADAAGASTATHFGVFGQARLDTVNGPSTLNAVYGQANLNAAGTVTTVRGVTGLSQLNNATAGSVTALIGVDGQVDAEDATLVTGAYGGRFTTPNLDTGTITDAYGVQIPEGIIGAGSITNQYGLNVGTIDNAATNNYGVYLNSVSGAATLNYGIYTNLGDVSLGDNLILRNDNDRLQIGASQDLELYHNGTDSIVDTNVGDLNLTAADDFVFTDAQVTAITLSDVDTTLPNSNTGIVDAINDAYNAAIGSSGGLWTDGGTTSYLTATTDELVLGGTSALSSAKFSIDGDADQIQLIIQGNATQTSDLFVVEQSDGTDILTASLTQVDITGDFDVSDQAVFGNAGFITAGQTLRVNNVFTDTSGTVYGGFFVNEAEAAGVSTATHYGSYSQSRLDTINGPANLIGARGHASLADGLNGTVTNIYGLWASTDIEDSSNVTAATGLRVETPSIDTGVHAGATYGIRVTEGTIGTGSIAAQYGLNVGNVTNATTNYGIYTNLGDVSLGDNLILRNDNDRLQIGAGQDIELYHNATDSFITNNTGILNIDTPGNLVLNSSAGTIDIGNDAVAQNINVGTGAAARTITVGNATGATALAFNSGTGSQTFTSQVITGTTTTSGFVLDATAITSGTGGYVTSDSITTGKLWDINTAAGNTLTTGTLLNAETTSTGVTGSSTGLLGYFNWNPGSTTTATGDLFRINIGSNGNVDNLFNVTDNGTSLFSVSETGITSAQPHSFTAAGDVSIAYDILMTNQTSSKIGSNTPLTIEAGESFENNNLTLKTFGTGDIVLDANDAVIVQAEFSLDAQATLEVDVTTPSVDGASHFISANTTNQLITAFDDGTNGQIIIIEIGDTNTDFDCTGSSLNCGTTNITAQVAGDIFTWIYDGTNWNLLVWLRSDKDLSGDIAGVDIAEFFVSSEPLVPGDVVGIDPTGSIKVLRTTTEYQSDAIGIISTSPGIVLGDPAEFNTFPVALAGRVPVKIASTSDPISAGDYLTASNEAGKAMKANRAGRMIGQALEPWDPGSGSNVVTVFVNPTWHDPNPMIAFDAAGNVVINDEAGNVLATFSSQQTIINSDNVDVKGNLEADSIATESAEIALEDSVLNVEARLTLLEAAILNDSIASDSATFIDLTVLDQSVLGDTIISGDLTVGTLLFDGITNSIDSIDTLHIQSLGLGGVDFVGGLVSIDTDGVVTAQKLAVKGESAGSATLFSGQSTVFITSNQVTSNSLIFVTPKTVTNSPLSVTNKQTGIGFTVESPTNASQNTEFDWFIVDKK